MPAPHFSPSQSSNGAAGAPHTFDRPPAHLLQLLLGHGLLGEHRRLDAVEEPFEPAHELGLGDAQLRLGRCVGREREHDLLELLAQVVGQHGDGRDANDRAVDRVAEFVIFQNDVESNRRLKCTSHII